MRDQVELYEGSGGTQGTTLRETGLPVVIVTNLGASSGKVRKTPVMRVEHDGRYAMVASKGGAPKHPVWYYNLRANPLVELQDGPHKQDMSGPRGQRRGARAMVGAGGRRIPALRGVPAEDHAADPGVRPGAGRRKLTPPRVGAARRRQEGVTAQPLIVPTPGMIGSWMLIQIGPACEHAWKEKAANVALRWPGG